MTKNIFDLTKTNEEKGNLMSDIFDLTDKSDLPFEIKEVKFNCGKAILDFFEENSLLTINQIRAALFRKYKIEKSRQFIISTLGYLIRIKHEPIRKISREVYEKATGKIS